VGDFGGLLGGGAGGGTPGRITNVEPSASVNAFSLPSKPKALGAPSAL